MKIEIGESLCYSYLRHVKGCWLVQTNWKSSGHWQRHRTDAELNDLFQEMRLQFDMGGKVFKQTASLGQFMQQAEIDVVGIDQAGGVHAMDVAFHENGLNYGGGAANRILKKMLRAYLLLVAYLPPQTTFHIYFVSPKVHKAVQAQLENIFEELQRQYPGPDWYLMTNEQCERVVDQTLEKAESVADTGELFVRATKLLNLVAPARAEPTTIASAQHAGSLVTTSAPGGRVAGPSLQDVVRSLMRTLLDESPSLLDDDDLRGLMDDDHCKNVLSLRISGHALLRERDRGREINGHSRYWRDVYGNRFYVCSQWWKDNHPHNAQSLLNFLDRLERDKPNHAAAAKLDVHRSRLRDLAVSE